MLGEAESHQDITAWEVAVKNYMRRDESFYPFVNVKTKWDMQAEDFGLVDEHNDSKLKRKKDELAEDLTSFLEIISGYIPGDHLRMKILQDSTSFKDCIKIIREFYGAEINAESELDFLKIQRKPQEPYRQFFERLASHGRQHLLPKNITVGSIKTGPDGDSMTCSHLNLIAQIWLQKINPKLLDIVKKEYGTQLQQGKVLCELVPEIAKNMDNLLKSDGTVQKVTFQDQQGTAGAIRRVLEEAAVTVEESLGETEVEELEEEAVDKIRRVFNRRRGGDNQRGRDRYRGRGDRGRDRDSSGHRNGSGFRGDKSGWGKELKKSKEHCAHCEYAKKVYGVPLDTRHHPRECPNKKSVVQLVNTYAGSSDSEGEAVRSKNSNNRKSFQTDPFEETTDRRVPPLPNEYQDSNILHFKDFKTNNSEIILAELSPSQLDSLTVNVRKTAIKCSPRKKKSPSIRGRIKGTPLIITIDEGAEMNILSAKLARKCNIPITPTRTGANSADGNGLKVIGQTLIGLSIICDFQGVDIELQLGRVIVVEGLEADVLLGEPGKRDNCLDTVASESKVYIRRDGKQYVTNYHYKGGGKDSYGVARVRKTQLIQPGQSINVEVPAELHNSDELVVNARKEDNKWFEPRVRKIVRGKVNIKNISDEMVRLTRGKPFGEFRTTSCETLPIYDVKRVILEDDDNFRYKKFGKKRDPKVSYLAETQVDPDNILSEHWKEKFKSLLKEYDQIIDPAPGKYNGKYGDSETLINFVDTPPPVEKVYTPNYSREMQKQLADKMDTLIDWGVLVRADDIGISVEHIAPSLLVPKTDGDGYRMVNDYSRLNNFIGKLPAVSPSMQDVKNAIARKKFVVHLDLSNYFYQGGMRRCDAQFLGVNHPFKGLYVYVCEPQGLRNASEHAYQRLAVIFGDMVRTDRMTRHADGLHVLGDTEQELYNNLSEVLFRVKESGLTLKPSKVTVAPVNSILFGWKLEDGKWFPTEHTISALAKCPKPTTAKKMRSFLGSYKQYTELMPRYAPLLHPLETAQGGKSSGEAINWTDELTKAFEAAQKSTEDFEAVTMPRPSDKLHTYSDYSQDTRSVGGKMLIERVEDGVTTWHLAGYYSATIDKNKTKWLPCEGEAAAIKMTLRHFTPWIVESENFTEHHTDNQACVQAWARLKKGAHSNSARISSFLSELSMLPVNITYKPGKDMHTSDFASRNPVKCQTPESCQICKFAREIETIGDKSALIRTVTVEDIKAGRSVLPLTQRKAWVDVQKKDSTLEKFKHLTRIGQSPNKHKTKGEHTIIKKLYRLFVEGNIMIDPKDEAVLVKTKDGAYSGYALVIPADIYPGLIHTLHIRLDHPSKSQLMALTQRYFYCYGFQSIIDQVTEGCLQCASVKKLPKVLLNDTTEATGSCGLQFAADVMEQHNQKVLLVREKLTQFMWATLIEDQKADTLETALLTMILPVVPSGGAVVRTDGGTGFQSLATRTDTELAKNSIKIELGRLQNINKNPQAENAVKEFEKEMLRYDPDIKILKKIDICHILKSINTRIRHQGLSSQEMLLKREMIQNNEIEVKDSRLSEKQMENREKQSEYQRKFQSKTKKSTPSQSFKVGQFVFIRNSDTKTSPRALHVVCSVTKVKKQDFIVIRKAEFQFRHRTYLVRPEELILAPIITDSTPPSDLETDEHETSVQMEAENETEEENYLEDNNLPLDNNTDADVRPEKPVRLRPRRKSAERARDLFTKVLLVDQPAGRKKRNVNPCLGNPYVEEEDEILVQMDYPAYPVRDSRVFPQSRAADDIGGFSLLSDSMEDDEDFSLSLLDTACLARTLDTARGPEEMARLMPPPLRGPPHTAPPDQLYGSLPLSRSGGAQPAGNISYPPSIASNSHTFHVNTIDTVNNIDNVINIDREEDTDTSAPPDQLYGNLPSLRSGGAQPTGDNLHLLSVATNSSPMHVITTDDTNSDMERDIEVNQNKDHFNQTRRRNTAASSDFRPSQTSTVLTTSSPHMARPRALSEVELTKNQDLSTVLREVHRLTPPAPPPVDRSKKSARKSVITSSRELRPRSESLDYKAVNEGRQFPAWKQQ